MYLREFSKISEIGANGIITGPGEDHSLKNLRSKILWYGPFKWGIEGVQSLHGQPPSFHNFYAYVRRSSTVCRCYDQ